MVGKGYSKCSIHDQLSILDGNATFDDPGLLLAMDIQVAFCSHVIGPVNTKIHLLDDLSAENSGRAFLRLDIVFIKVITLKAAVKPLKGSCIYPKGKLV